MLTHILPLTLDDFKAWMLQGELRLPVVRLVAVATTKEGSLNADPSVAEAIAALLPDFQEEHEVLLAEVRMEPQVEWASLAPAVIHLDFAAVKAIYPTTERATEQLARRLAGMRLSSAPFSERLAQEGILRLKRHLLLGGRAMLRLVKQETHQEDFERKYTEAVWAASKARDQELSWPESAENLWSSLFLYERRNTKNRYPDTDAGFLFDIAAQFTTTSFGLGNEQHKAEMTRMLRALSDFWTPLAQDNRPLSGSVLQESWELFAPLYTLLDRSSPPAGAIFLFFLLRAELRRNAAPDWQVLRLRLHKYFSNMPAEDFALGVWLAGMFFGVRELATLVQTNTHELLGAVRPLSNSKATPSIATPEARSSKEFEPAGITAQVHTGLDLIKDPKFVYAEDYREAIDLPIISTKPSSKESTLAEPIVIQTPIVAPASSLSPVTPEKTDVKTEKPSKKAPAEASTAPKRRGRPPKNSKAPELPLSTTPQLDSEE